MKAHTCFNLKESGFKLAGTMLLTTALVACGGGSGSGDPAPDNNTGGGNIPETGNLIVPPSCNLESIGGSSTSVQLGVDGDFHANCDEEEIFVDYGVTLANGIPSMNVVSVERTMEFASSCSNGDVSKATFSADYKTGVITMSGASNGQSMSCIDRYDAVQFPITISTSESISELLFGWGVDDDGTGFISSTCPEDETDDAVVDCSGSSLYNIVVTDDQGNKHRVASKTGYGL